MNKYYVYLYLREDNTPYYVGKGEGDRCYKKHPRKGGKFVPVPPKHRIVKIKENLTAEESLELERELISLYGRKDIGTGILHNLTEGGEGVIGMVPYIRTEETRRRVSEALLEHYKNNPKPKKVKVKLTREQKTELVSNYMNNHWNSERGEEQKELYRERSRERIQQIVDSIEVPPPTGRNQVLFFGKVFSSQREVSRLVGCSREYVSMNFSSFSL